MPKLKANQPSDTGPTFEQSLTRLQEIVGELESGELGLEDSLERFEAGMSLLRTCYQTLERAEQRIEILTGMNADGIPLTEPFDGTATLDLTVRKTKV